MTFTRRLAAAVLLAGLLGGCEREPEVPPASPALAVPQQICPICSQPFRESEGLRAQDAAGQEALVCSVGCRIRQEVR